MLRQMIVDYKISRFCVDIFRSLRLSFFEPRIPVGRERESDSGASTDSQFEL